MHRSRHERHFYSLLQNAKVEEEDDVDSLLHHSKLLCPSRRSGCTQLILILLCILETHVEHVPVGAGNKEAKIQWNFNPIQKDQTSKMSSKRPKSTYKDPGTLVNWHVPKQQFSFFFSSLFFHQLGCISIRFVEEGRSSATRTYVNVNGEYISRRLHLFLCIHQRLSVHFK